MDYINTIKSDRGYGTSSLCSHSRDERRFLTIEQIQILLEVLIGDETVAGPCCQEGIALSSFFA